MIEDNIYYLNLKEIGYICSKYNIPYHVYYKYNDIVYKSNTLLRKGKIIKNILKKIHDKKVPKFIIPEINVSFNKNINPNLSDPVYFGQFNWTHIKKKLFPEFFKPVLCHLMLYDLWHKNKKITYRQFINYYKKHEVKYQKLEHPEWRYIEDTRNNNKVNWKKKRNKIAKIVLKNIEEILNERLKN